MDVGLIIDHSGHVIYWQYPDLLVEGSNTSFTVRNKQYPSQTLFISDANAFKKIKALRKQAGIFGTYERMVHSPTWFKWTLFLAIVGISIAAYFFWVPTLASHAVRLMPTSVDKEIGDIFYHNTLKSSLDIDSNATQIVKQFADELPYDGEIPVTILVDKSSQVNAFALPNGIIIVNTGIIEKMETPSELLAVLGHEMTHVSERHSVRMMTKNLASLLMISIIFSDINGIAQILIDNTQQLQSLSYSRQYEESADKGSFELLKKARISPQGLIDLFETLEKETKGTSIVPEFLQTHPLSNNRVKSAKELIKKYPYQVDSNSAEIDAKFRQLKKEIE